MTSRVYPHTYIHKYIIYVLYTSYVTTSTSLLYEIQTWYTENKESPLDRLSYFYSCFSARNIHPVKNNTQPVHPPNTSRNSARIYGAKFSLSLDFLLIACARLSPKNSITSTFSTPASSRVSGAERATGMSQSCIQHGDVYCCKYFRRS